MKDKGLHTKLKNTNLYHTQLNIKNLQTLKKCNERRMYITHDTFYNNIL